jgi:hypothetical protein
VVVEHGQELLVVDIPESVSGLVLAKKAKMGEQLAKPDIRRKLAHLGQQDQRLSLNVTHGTRLWSGFTSSRIDDHLTARTSEEDVQ